MVRNRTLIAAGIIGASIFAGLAWSNSSNRYTLTKGDDGSIYRLDRQSGQTIVVHDPSVQKQEAANRLAYIRSECHRIAQQRATELLKEKAKLNPYLYGMVQQNMYLKDDYESSYKECLREAGLGE